MSDIQWIYAGQSFGGTPMLVVFGIASAVLSVVAFLPYLRDIVTGRTKPLRASWLIWSLLGTVSLAAQVVEGAGTSLLFAAVQVALTGLTLLLSCIFGAGRFITEKDYPVLVAAMAGLLLWLYTDNPVYALGFSIGVSLLGGFVMGVKSFSQPDSETLSTWVLLSLAALLATLSVGEIDWILLAYPLYLFVLYAAFTCVILQGRRVQRRQRLTRIVLPMDTQFQ